MRGAARLRMTAWLGLLLPTGVIETRPADVVVANPFTLITIVRGVLPAVVLLILVAATHPKLRPQGVRETLLTAYLMVVLASASWSLAPTATLFKAAHLVVAYGLVVLIVRHWRDRREAIDELALVIFLIVAAAAFGALVDPQRSIGPSGRLLSVFPALQPTVLGLFCASAVLLAYAAIGPGPLFRRLWFRVPVAVTSLTLLLLTGSRVPLVLLLLGLSAYGWRIGHPKIVVRNLALLAIALAGLLFSPLGDAMRPRLSPESLFASGASLGGRLPLWQAAFEVISERPLLGYGYYAGHRLGDYAQRFSAIIIEQPPYVDGTWLETALDLGLLGCTALAAFVGCSTAMVWRSARGNSALGAIHIVILIIALLYGLQDYTVQQVSYPMAIFGAALLAPLRDPRTAREPKRQLDALP
jgi:O-antigen ligase